MSFREQAKGYNDPEQMAKDYLASYFGNNKIEYPINPFKMLRDEGIFFALSDFKNLDGVYIPAEDREGVPVVGININRPITRQRYTAAHELCHHFRDYDKETSCTPGSKDPIEQFAESFAAAVLMPLTELRSQVDKRKNAHGKVSFDDILEIADFFGVSFESCMWRVAYQIHAIDGKTEASALRKRMGRYTPDKKRKAKHMTYAGLYADFIDSYANRLTFQPDDYARFVFQNNYIYNDSRMEGLDTSIEEASEIVADLRLNTQNSIYCNESNEAYMSIAGHYDMYQYIFEEPDNDDISVYNTFILNKKLFSYYPFPEFGGSVRQNNTLVLGAKFETVDYQDIYTELTKLDAEVKECYAEKGKNLVSSYIKHVARIHHKLTVIHPFHDGNGRTTRAFMNVQLVRADLPPIYIRVEEKEDYTKALERADKTGDYDELYEIVFKNLLRSHVDLRK